MGLTYQLGYKLSNVIARLFFNFRVHGREKMIEQGGCVLAMNHESYLDPPFAGLCCHREIHFLARKTLLAWPIIGSLLPRVNVIPVDQERADMSALKTVIKLVKAGHCTVVFPEGSRTPDGQLQPALPGLGLIIARTLCPVVPMRIFGAHAAFPRGGRPRPFTRITIVIGDPLHFTVTDLAGEKRDLYQRLSDRVMERIATIKNVCDAS